MKWGKFLKSWQRLIEMGRQPPDVYFERPEIEPHLALFWSDFWELSTERQIGMAIGSIPRSKIREYFSEEIGLAGLELDYAVDLTRRVDSEYVGMSSSDSDDIELADSAKATDAEGIKRVMRGLGSRFKQTRKPKMK